MCGSWRPSSALAWWYVTCINECATRVRIVQYVDVFRTTISTNVRRKPYVSLRPRLLFVAISTTLVHVQDPCDQQAHHPTVWSFRWFWGTTNSVRSAEAEHVLEHDTSSWRSLLAEYYGIYDQMAVQRIRQICISFHWNISRKSTDYFIGFSYGLAVALRWIQKDALKKNTELGFGGIWTLDLCCSFMTDKTLRACLNLFRPGCDFCNGTRLLVIVRSIPSCLCPFWISRQPSNRPQKKITQPNFSAGPRSSTRRQGCRHKSSECSWHR